MAVNTLEMFEYLYISELLTPIFVMYQLSLLQCLLLIGTFLKNISDVCICWWVWNSVSQIHL